MAANAKPAHTASMSATPSRIKRRLIVRRAVAAGAAMLAGVSIAAAADCNYPPAGAGRVTAIIDGRSFRLDDGREIRLAGVEAEPDGAAADENSAAALGALLLGHDVTLQAAAAQPDRYGRLVALVFQTGTTESVQETLLEQGRLLAAGTLADRGCSLGLAARETVARNAKRGYWSDSAALKNAEIPGDILAVMGRFAVVEGRVSSVRQAGGTIYINFGRRWTRDFAVTISRRLLRAFEAAGLQPKALENRTIRVRGWVERRGGPRMQAFAPGQIDIADEGGRGESRPRKSSRALSQELSQELSQDSDTRRTP